MGSLTSRPAKVRQAGLYPFQRTGQRPGLSRDMGMNQRGSIVIYLALALGILVIVAKMGHSVYSTIEESVWSEVRKEKAEETKRAALKAGKASATLEAGNVKARVIYRRIMQTVDRYIDRPIYRNICLDVDGLRDANSALTGQITPPGKPNKPVSRLITTYRWEWGIRVAENH